MAAHRKAGANLLVRHYIVLLVLSDLAGHLSSPPPPVPSLGHYASAQHPFTTQHPHPVPLTMSPRAYLEGNTTYVDENTPSPGDFIPLTGSGRTQNVDDGLDLLVTPQEFPSGTPGGKKADLRRGAFVDGARHEKAGKTTLNLTMTELKRQLSDSFREIPIKPCQILLHRPTRHSCLPKNLYWPNPACLKIDRNRPSKSSCRPWSPNVCLSMRSGPQLPRPFMKEKTRSGS